MTDWRWDDRCASCRALLGHVPHERVLDGRRDRLDHRLARALRAEVSLQLPQQSARPARPSGHRCSAATRRTATPRPHEESAGGRRGDPARPDPGRRRAAADSGARSPPADRSTSRRPACIRLTRSQRTASSMYGVETTIGQALRAEPGQEVPELLAAHRVHPGGRLVEEQDLGTMHQGAAQRELLLHAAGERAGPPPGELLELDPDRRDRVTRLGDGGVEERGEEGEVLQHAEIGIEREAAGHVPDPLSAGPTGPSPRRGPSTWAVPASGRSRVTRIRKRVVLPAPSGPITPYSSPGPTSKDTSWSATVSP